MPLMIGMAVFLLSTYLAHKIRGKESSIEWVWDGFFGLVSTLIVGCTVFLFYLVFIFPVHVYREDQNRGDLLSQKNSQISSITLQLNESQARATRLSDALNMSKDSVQSETQIRQLKLEVDNLKQHALTDGAYVDPDEWTPLTNDQIDIWSKALWPFKVRAYMVSVVGNDEDKLGQSLRRVFSQQNAQYVFYEINNCDPGITILAWKDEPVLPVLKQLFTDSHIPFKVQPQPDSSFTDVEIFIGDKTDTKITPPAPKP